MKIPRFTVGRLLLLVFFLALAFSWIRLFADGGSAPVFLVANVILGALLGAAVGTMLGQISTAALAGGLAGLAFFVFALLF